MYIFLAILLLIFPRLGQAEEPGYKEALEYFIYRKKQKQKNQGNYVETSQEPKQEYLPQAYKWTVGLGGGEDLGLDFYSVEVGLSFLNSKYFQQSLSLEYLRLNSENSEDFSLGAFQNTFSTAFFLNHSVQLSSRLFFLSPDLTLGIVRRFGEPDEGAQLVLKPGLVISNRWSKKLLYSIHVYYRRTQFFSKNFNGDGLGFTLKVGF